MHVYAHAYIYFTKTLITLLPQPNIVYKEIQSDNKYKLDHEGEVNSLSKTPKDQRPRGSYSMNSPTPSDLTFIPHMQGRL